MQRKEHLKKNPLVKGSDEQRVEQFEHVLRKYDKNAEAFYTSGYIHFRSDLLTGLKGRMISAAGTPYDKKRFDDYQHILGRDLVRGDPVQRKVARKILSSEYKIHLMPKPEYMLPIAELMMQSAKDDPEFGDLIFYFKIYKSADKSRGPGETMPNIVIYPRLGKKNATELLIKLHKLFSRFDIDEIAEPGHLIPRRNVQINNLLYYSQGGSDVKKEIIARVERDELDLDEYLTKQQRHYARGETLDIDKIKGKAKGNPEDRDRKEGREREQKVIREQGLVEKERGKEREQEYSTRKINGPIFKRIKVKMERIFNHLELMPDMIKEVTLYKGHEGETKFPHLRVILAGKAKIELSALQKTLVKAGIDFEMASKGDNEVLMISTKVPTDNLLVLLDDFEERFQVKYNVEKIIEEVQKEAQQKKPSVVRDAWSDMKYLQEQYQRATAKPSTSKKHNKEQNKKHTSSSHKHSSSSKDKPSKNGGGKKP